MSYIGKSAMTSKGQITIPSAMRERYGLVPGDDVEFFEGGDGSIKVRIRRRTAEPILGRLAHLTPDPGYGDDEAIADEVVARDERSKNSKGSNWE